MVGVAVDSKTRQQWFIREEARSENIDRYGDQDVRDDEQGLGEGCYAILRALHLLRCVAQWGKEKDRWFRRGGTMSCRDDAPSQ